MTTQSDRIAQREPPLDLRYSESDEKFRAELRAWLQEMVPAHGQPPRGAGWDERRAYDTAWQRKLFDAGYAGINWPKEYGGRDGFRWHKEIQAVPKHDFPVPPWWPTGSWAGRTP